MAFKRGRSLRSLLTHLKPKKTPWQRPGVVYHIPCGDCHQIYIGGTARTGETRIKEHKRAIAKADEKNGIFDHVAKTGHMIDWNNASILMSEDRWHPRKTLEALCIKALDRWNGMRNGMNLEQGAKFHQSWDMFLPQIRTEIQDKIQRHQIKNSSSLSQLPMPRRKICRDQA